MAGELIGRGYITIAGLKDGDPAEMYRIVGSVTNITRSMTGELSATSLKCYVYKITGETARELTADKTLRYRRVGVDSSEQTIAHPAGVTADIAVTPATERIELTLYDSDTKFDDTTLLDRETIPVVTDASDMEMSARNLLIGSKDFTVDASATSTQYVYKSFPLPIPLTKGDYVAFMVEGIENVAGSPTQYSCGVWNSNTSTNISGGTGTLTASERTVVFKITADELSPKFLIYAGKAGATAGNSVRYTKAILVKGNVPMQAWSPAPEDIENRVDTFDYLKEALKGATQINGGLVLSSLFKLGTWTQASDPDQATMSVVYAGMNGVYDNTRTIASWWGGDMVDRFNSSDNPITPVPANAASALVRMDGTGYFAKGNIRWKLDGSGEVAGGNIIWDANGNVTIGSGITIGGTTDMTLGSVLKYVNALNTLLVPVDKDGNSLDYTEVENAVAIKATKDFFSTGSITALGKGSGGSGSGGGGASYSRLDNWPDYTADKAGYVLSAALGYDLKTRIDNLPTTSVNPYALTFGGKTYDGSQAVTLTAADLGALTTHQIIYSLTIQKNGTAIGTYSPATQSATINISDVASAATLSSHTGNSTIHITAAERTKWNTTSSSLDSIMGTDSDTIINKWEEVVAFLDTYTEADTLAGLLGNKADKTIKISAGQGLSGGGDLSSNRTLSLKPATTGTLGGVIVGNGLAVDEAGLLVLAYEYSLPTASASTLGGVKVGPTLEIDANGVLNQKANVVTAETYPKVAVDTFGRVIGGSSLAATDIPSLPWSKITSGKPTTLLGYGITDAYTKTEINTKLTDGSVTKVGTATVGSSVEPIYLSNGAPTVCGYSFGNASGNAALNNGTLNTNLNADLLDGYHKESFDGYKFTQIDASELDNDVWYPVIFTVPVSKQTRVRVEGLSTTNASWNSRTDKQMAVYLDYTVQGSGWGFVAPLRVVHFFKLGAGASSSNCVAGLGQLGNSSKEYVMVRGGAFYNFYISHWITPVLYTSTYTANNQSISPVTTSPTAIVRNSALISDNVNSATKLQTARTINGTSFDGSASITTANWGTARNIGIVNSDGTGTAVTTSVNGSANVNLKLPATIKASLTGNASTATTLQTARTIALSGAATGSASFNGSANVTIETSNVYLSLQDVRSENVSAGAYSKSLRYLFVANSTDSLADGGGYHSVLHFAQWVGDTGGNMKQLALTDNGNLYLRRGTYSTGTWTSWVKFLNTTNYASTLDSRYVLLSTAQTITGLKTFTQSVHLKHSDYSTGGNAKMIVFDDYQDNAVGSFGSLANNNVFQYIYAGWGTTPWNLSFCLAISSDRFTYKNNDVLHVGNYTDTLDTRYALKSSAMIFRVGANYVAARFNDENLASIAHDKYIEFWQSNAGWFNLKAGKFMVNGGTSSHFLKGDGSLDNNSYATTSQLTDGSVTKIGTQHVGSVSKGIYLNAGVPTAMTHSLAATVNAGTAGRLTYYSSTTAIAAYSSTVGGTARPMYLNAGVPTGLSADVGHAAKPIFLSAGTLTACSSTVGGVAKPVYLNAGEITACSSTVGSASLPVYMSAGTLTVCGTSLAVSITGNAASATYASNVRVSTLNPTSLTAYYLHFTTGISSGTNDPLYGNNGIRYQTIEGTTGSLGVAELLLGNNTTSGTAGNKYGAIRLYDTTNGYTSYRTYNAAGRNLYLVGTANSVAVGSSLKPVYVSSAGVVTAFSNTIGSATTPVYVNAGTITNCSYSFGNNSGNVPISNGTLNTNLNANYLNGLEESRFFLTNRGTIPTAFVDLTTSTSGNADYANYSSGTYSIQSSSSTELFINFALNTGSTSALQLKTSYSTASTLYYRKTIDANRVSGDWSHFITSENIASQTVSKANSLVTARTIWGQSFNGSANVSGALSNVGNITPAANATYSCGTAASRWSSVYASNYLYVGATGLTSPNSGVSGCVLSAEGCLELIGGKYAYIDFHYDGSTSDYTNRIIEGVSGQLTVTGSLRIGLAYATSSSYKFYVAGTAYISSTLKVASTADYASSSAAFSTTGSIFASKNIYAAGAVTAKASSSDIRLKKDISDYNALSLIRKFKSVKYHWNELAKQNSDIFKNDKWQYGLIAQDFIKEGYEQFTSDVFKDYLVINYERLIPIIWKGLQEIDRKIEELKESIKS